MKKFRKLLAFALAMTMAFSLMAMTAAAYGEDAHDHECAACSEETIQPRGPVGPCPKCRQNVPYQELGLGTNENGSPAHVRLYHCPSCGSFKWYIPV